MCIARKASTKRADHLPKGPPPDKRVLKEKKKGGDPKVEKDDKKDPKLPMQRSVRAKGQAMESSKVSLLTALPVAPTVTKAASEKKKSGFKVGKTGALSPSHHLPEKPAAPSTLIKKKKNLDEWSVWNDKTEFLENAQLTKLMSKDDIRALMGGAAQQVENDDNSCRDTIDEVDEEMPDIVFSPLLIQGPKEECQPIVADIPVKNEAPIKLEKKESNEKPMKKA